MLIGDLPEMPLDFCIFMGIIGISHFCLNRLNRLRELAKDSVHLLSTATSSIAKVSLSLSQVRHALDDIRPFLWVVLIACNSVIKVNTYLDDLGLVSRIIVMSFNYELISCVARHEWKRLDESHCLSIWQNPNFNFSQISISSLHYWLGQYYPPTSKNPSKFYFIGEPSFKSPKKK